MIEALSPISHDGILYEEGDIFEAGEGEEQLISVGSAKRVYPKIEKPKAEKPEVKKEAPKAKPVQPKVEEKKAEKPAAKVEDKKPAEKIEEPKVENKKPEGSEDINK